MPCSPFPHSRRLRSLPALLLSALALPAAAAPVLELKPGLWANDSEIWINGQSLKPALQALNAKVRAKLSEAQKREYDREQGGGRQACLTPQQARIDLARYLESAFAATGGPWRCDAQADKLDASAAAGSYTCRTGGGGLSQGKFSASYSPTNYKLELNGRGNAVDGRTGDALSGTEMDQRMLSTGRWLGESC